MADPLAHAEGWAAGLRLGAQLRRTAAPVTPGELSPSELAVVGLLADGLTNREIGERLFVSVNTVKTHLRHAYAKLPAASREEAIARVRERGLL